jgi:hypothetical protein
MPAGRRGEVIQQPHPVASTTGAPVGRVFPGGCWASQPFVRVSVETANTKRLLIVANDQKLKGGNFFIPCLA